MTLPRVTHLTAVHPVDDPRINKEVLALEKAGYDVALVGAPPRSATAGPPANVVTLPQVQGRFKRLTFSGPRILLAAVRSRAAIVHIHDPELIWVGLVLKAFGRDVVYDVHEHLPHQVLGKQWIPKPIRPVIAKVAAALEAVADRSFDGIVIANPSSLRRFANRRRVLVQNFAEPPAALSPERPYRSRPHNVVYVGAITPERGLWTMVRAINEVREPSARLILAGEVAESLRDEIPSRDPGHRVSLTGWLDRQQVSELLGNARIGLSVLEPVPNYIANYPTKLFEYMAAGIPSIVSNYPLWLSVVDESHCGEAVDPMNASQLAAAIDRLLADPEQAEAMGAAGRRSAGAKYSWPSQARSLQTLYSELALRRA